MTWIAIAKWINKQWVFNYPFLKIYDNFFITKCLKGASYHPNSTQDKYLSFQVLHFYYISLLEILKLHSDVLVQVSMEIFLMSLILHWKTLQDGLIKMYLQQGLKFILQTTKSHIYKYSEPSRSMPCLLILWLLASPVAPFINIV